MSLKFDLGQKVTRTLLQSLVFEMGGSAGQFPFGIHSLKLVVHLINSYFSSFFASVIKILCQHLNVYPYNHVEMRILSAWSDITVVGISGSRYLGISEFFFLLSNALFSVPLAL